MTTKRQLTNSWQQLRNSVSAFLRSVGSNTTLANWPELCFKPDTEHFEAFLPQPVVLLDVPPRAKTRRSWRLVIAIDAHFTISSQHPGDLLHYGTRVSYFGMRKTSTQEMRRLHSFHYDMDVSGLANHPIFHAQPYEGVCIDQLEPIRLLDGFSIAEDQDSIPAVQNIRIPTAQMDVLSVCVMLLADHYLEEDDRSADQAFASFVLESVVSRSPLLAQNQPRMIEFFEKVQGGGIDIRSSHWYPFDRS